MNMFEEKNEKGELGGKPIPRPFRMDVWGKMPDLMEILEMRENEEAYLFFFMVFVSAHVGESKFDQTILHQSYNKSTAINFPRHFEESWLLFNLEDKWAALMQEVKREFEKQCHSYDIQLGTTDGEVRNGDGVGLDVRSRVKSHLKDAWTSTKGVSAEGKLRLEWLGERVAKNRVEFGGSFVEHMRSKRGNMKPVETIEVTGGGGGGVQGWNYAFGEADFEDYGEV